MSNRGPRHEANAETAYSPIQKCVWRKTKLINPYAQVRSRLSTFTNDFLLFKPNLVPSGKILPPERSQTRRRYSYTAAGSAEPRLHSHLPGQASTFHH